MEKLTLNFFGEKIDIDIPKTFDTLKREIGEKFAFTPSEVADLLISYAKDLGKKIIETEEDFKEFATKKINLINLDIKEDSKIYLDSLETLKAQAKSDHSKLEELLRQKEEIEVEKKKLLEIQKKEIEKFNKEYKEEAKKKLELIKKMNQNLKKIKKEKHLQTKKIQKHTKELEKTENETITKIIELQKKLGYPVTVVEPKKTIKKKPIVKKVKKVTFVEKQFGGVNNVINKMIEKVNKLVNVELAKEKANIEKKEKEVHESKIVLKPEEEKGFIDFKKISNDITSEINKWTNFVMCHTNELTENFTKKYKECKEFLTPVENKLKGKKKLEEKEIHHFYICDGCEMNPIKGIRYHCKDCPDFDFCENCFENKKNEHKHNFEAIKKSTDPAPVKNDKAVHLGVACDGCGMYPIVGNRYKCAVCKNFDYCEKCEEKFTEKEHLHPFIKIYSPKTKIASIKCVVDENCPDYQNKKK